MSVMVLLAGSSEAFKEAGYVYPKSLVEIAGKPVIEHVIESQRALFEQDDKCIFVIRRDEELRFHLGAVINLLMPHATVVLARDETAGAACTALLGIDYINNERPLVIMNGDQILDIDLAPVVRDWQEQRLDGGIVVFPAVHPRWSYVLCDSEGYVIEAAEKRPISNLATAGTYYFARGSEFVQAAVNTIRKDANVDGKFYICPVYNELILEQRRVGITRIDGGLYHSLATPQGVVAYEELLRQKREVSRASFAP